MVKKVIKKKRKKKVRKFGIILFATIVIIIFAEVFVMVNDGKENPRDNLNPTNTSSQSSPVISATNGPITTNTGPSLSAEPLNSSPVSIEIGNLDNTSASWYYMPASKLFSDIKSTTNSNMVSLAEKYNSIWQDATNQKTVYITMDTGEDCNSNLNSIMKVAKEKNVKITFFLTGGYMKRFPDMVKKMDSEGHIVANHTVNHLNLPQYLDKNGLSKFEKEITDVAAEYKQITGKTMIKLLRPPEGAYSEKVLGITSNMGYRLAFWSFAYRDWVSDEQPAREYAMDKILGQLHPGSVILLHPKSQTNTEMFSDLIDSMISRGYGFKGLDEFPDT